MSAQFDVELDQAFQLGAGAFDVLRQRFVIEGFADAAGSEGAGGFVEDGEDAGVVRVLGQVRRVGLDGNPVGEGRDGLPGDRQVFEVGLGFPQPGLQSLDLGADVVGQCPGGILLLAERVE
ncbi:hypothetical protein [Streptomyces misionensis]|uniref:hypothetical protein n=1 Tax=Streptomyces misionensis TaxID=67331 RepID=UPI0033FDA46F